MQALRRHFAEDLLRRRSVRNLLAVARALGPGHTVVTFLCDGGARHASRFWNDGVVQRVAEERGDAALADALREGAAGSRRRGWL